MVWQRRCRTRQVSRLLRLAAESEKCVPILSRRISPAACHLSYVVRAFSRAYPVFCFAGWRADGPQGFDGPLLAVVLRADVHLANVLVMNNSTAVLGPPSEIHLFLPKSGSFPVRV